MCSDPCNCSLPWLRWAPLLYRNSSHCLDSDKFRLGKKQSLDCGIVLLLQPVIHCEQCRPSQTQWQRKHCLHRPSGRGSIVFIDQVAEEVLSSQTKWQRRHCLLRPSGTGSIVFTDPVAQEAPSIIHF